VNPGPELRVHTMHDGEIGPGRRQECLTNGLATSR
jgi:hypothetical protein